MEADLNKAELTNDDDVEDVCQTMDINKYNQVNSKSGTSGLAEKANPNSVDERKITRKYEIRTISLGRGTETDEAPFIM